MKYIGVYSNDADIATKKNIDTKQDKVLANGVLQGDGSGNITAAETTEVELVTLDKSSVGLGNVDNVKQYSASNPPPYPVTSVNNKMGAVTLTASDIGAATISDIHTALNRTNAVNVADSNYTTYMARGEALFSAETTPTVNGCIAWQYE